MINSWNLIYMFLISSFYLMYFSKHLLMVLISLEFLMILTCYIMFFIYVSFNFSVMGVVVILCLFVCEGVLGLSLLVMMVRVHGNDYLNSLSLLKW